MIRCPTVSPRSLVLALLFTGLAPAALEAGEPAAPLDDSYSQGDSGAVPLPSKWWSELGRPSLDRLVDQALAGNADLAVSAARIQQARGAQIQAVSPLLPTASFDVNLSASPSDGAAFQLPPQTVALFESLAVIEEQFGGGTSEPADEESPDLTWNGSALLSLAYRIDPGRSIAGLRAAQLEAAAARGDWDQFARSLVQQVVSTWLDLRSAQAQEGLLLGQEAAHVNLLELTQQSFEGGRARAADVLLQRQQLAGTRALLPQARQAQALQQIRLETLVGGAVDLDEKGGLPAIPPRPALGRPSELVEARPDLRSAARRARAARERVASAALGFAPSLRIQASFGKRLRWYNKWDAQDTWSLGGAVEVPIFGGLQRVGQLKQARAGQWAADQAYTAAIRRARAEVESALAREEAGQQRLASLDVQLRVAQESFAESRAQYAGGLRDYLSVLTSLLSLQAAELTHLGARRDLLAARVDLYTALGAPVEHSPSQGAKR